jgi:hypothetical protein
MAGMIIPILALAALAAPQPDPSKGSGLYQECKSAIKLQDSSHDISDDIQGVACLSYVAGFIDGINRQEPHICFGKATGGTVARVYVAYMDKHPKLLDDAAVEGLELALVESYPCTTK